jgi:hypothetical protein
VREERLFASLNGNTVFQSSSEKGHYALRVLCCHRSRKQSSPSFRARATRRERMPKKCKNESPTHHHLLGIILTGDEIAGAVVSESEATRLQTHLSKCTEDQELFHEIDSTDPVGVLFINLTRVAAISIKPVPHHTTRRKQKNILVRFANGLGTKTFEQAEAEDIKLLAHSLNCADHLSEFVYFQTSTDGNVFLQHNEVAYVALPCF